MAKTFIGATRMWTTTRNGPSVEDVHIRRIWSLSKGKLIDECGSEDLPPISSINAHSDALVHWLLQVQCVLAQAAGMVCSTKSAEFPVSPGLHSPSPSSSCSTTLATRSPYTSCV